MREQSQDDGHNRTSGGDLGEGGGAETALGKRHRPLREGRALNGSAGETGYPKGEQPG